ncbi:MAG: hypothetical protein LCH72_03650 [Proteobacteria bacterium]|nr:hypothetical protein [Pseudomonadota bacterium]
MRFFIASLSIAAVLGAATGAQAACYTVLGPKGQILSESPNPPVDMSLPLHQSVPERFGSGAVMVFGLTDGACGQTVDLDDALLPTVAALRQDGRARARAPRRDRE